MKSTCAAFQWLNKPFLRGSLALIDAMALGIKALTYAANVQATDVGADPHPPPLPRKRERGAGLGGGAESPLSLDSETLSDSPLPLAGEGRGVGVSSEAAAASATALAMGEGVAEKQKSPDGTINSIAIGIDHRAVTGAGLWAVLDSRRL